MRTAEDEWLTNWADSSELRRAGADVQRARNKPVLTLSRTVIGLNIETL